MLTASREAKKRFALISKAKENRSEKRFAKHNVLITLAKSDDVDIFIEVVIIIYIFLNINYSFSLVNLRIKVSISNRFSLKKDDDFSIDRRSQIRELLIVTKKKIKF